MTIVPLEDGTLLNLDAYARFEISETEIVCRPAMTDAEADSGFTISNQRDYTSVRAVLHSRISRAWIDSFKRESEYGGRTTRTKDDSAAPVRGRGIY